MKFWVMQGFFAKIEKFLGRAAGWGRLSGAVSNKKILDSFVPIYYLILLPGGNPCRGGRGLLGGLLHKYLEKCDRFSVEPIVRAIRAGGGFAVS